MTTVLLTGATGFIGSRTAEILLENGMQVRSLVRDLSRPGFLPEGCATVEGDLLDSASLARAVEGVDFLVHGAGLTRARRTSDFFRINVDGSEHLYRAAARHAPRLQLFVNLSSQAAAGPGTAGEPRSENDPPSPLSPYGVSKLAAEEKLTSLSGPPVISLRLSAVYGPRDREIFPFFQAACRGFVPMVSPPNGRIQLLHVDDAAGAILKALNTGKPGTCFIAHPAVYTHRDLIDIMGEAAGKKVKVLRVPPPLLRLAAWVNASLARVVGTTAIFNPGKARELLADNWTCTTKRAEDMLHFTPHIDFSRGCRETLQWYREHRWIR